MFDVDRLSEMTEAKGGGKRLDGQIPTITTDGHCWVNPPLKSRWLRLGTYVDIIYNLHLDL